MPSPERPRGSEAEHEPQPYSRAARFPGEQPAGRAYCQAQDAIYRAREEVDLSAYRFHLDRVWHVAVLGESPPAELDERLQQILAAGEPTDLPADILQQLLARRAQASQLGGWVEGHHRPGRRLPPADH